MSLFLPSDDEGDRLGNNTDMEDVCLIFFFLL